MIFAFGPHSKENEGVEIDVLRYEREPVGDPHDDNWLTVKIEIAAGGFRGKAGACILTWELKRFLESLQSLYKTLHGEAVFQTLEEQIELKLSGDGKGHIHLDGKVLDQAGVGNCLTFEIDFDQTELFGSICELEDIVEHFPVRGDLKK